MNLFELPEQLKVIPDGSDIVNSVKRDVEAGTPIVIDNGEISRFGGDRG